MKELAADLDVHRASFTGEVFGVQKADLLAKAELFVLPTHSENFGLAVAEALAHSTQVIVTYGAPWSGVKRHHRGLMFRVAR